MTSQPDLAATLSKVPAITLGFWAIKILATTLGETGGDTLSMTYDLGYLASSVIFIVPLVLLVAAQIRAKGFHPALYWTTIIASTTAGTTMADFATRSLGIGYTGGSALLLALVLMSLLVWHRTMGTVSVNRIASARAEGFYWATITLSQTLGTALGDWAADDGGLGYLGGALVFGLIMTLLAGLYYFRAVSHVVLFWAAFIFTRPLGATVGDFLDKPLDQGGLDFSRPVASAVLLVAIVLMIWMLPQRPAEHTAD
ncbi:MAG: hypothetical protein ABI673_04155 [Novosphingobium sp.]